MSLQKYIFILLSIFMQFVSIDATNEKHETDMQDKIEEYNDHEESNDNIKYLLLTAGVLTIGGLAYWYQFPLASMVMQRFGNTINEKGQVIINSQKAMAIMNKNKSKNQPLQNVSLRGAFVMEEGKFTSAAFTDGSYFSANGINYVVKN